MASPIGPLILTAEEGALTSIDFDPSPPARTPVSADQRSHLEPSAQSAARPDPILFEAARQLDAYFCGELREFDLTLSPRGTPFQLIVWRALRDIPFGETVSYAEVARRIGRPTAARAVGRANALNPLPIVVPCHRVIGADGSLTGFAGGLGMKAALLELEASRSLDSLEGGGLSTK